MKDLKKVLDDQGIYVETAQHGIVLSGYVDTSYTYQFAGTIKTPKDSAAGLAGAGSTLRENGNTSPVPSSEAVGRQFDTDANDFNINAFKLTLEKALSDKVEYTAGFRADLMFGEDAKILAASDPATSTDDIFLEQAYASFRVPIGNGLDFKIGKFVTLLGYEIIESPGNINFSRGLLFTNAIPLTHTGILASYKFSEMFDAQLGLVDGWNNSDSGAGGIEGFGKAVTGRVAFNAPGGNATVAASFIYSADGETGNIGPGFVENENTYVVDIWAQWYPSFVADKGLLLAANVDFGGANHAGADAAFGGGSDYNANWWGAAVYAKYQFNKCWSFAARGEYFHSYNGLKAPVGSGTNSVYIAPNAGPGARADLWSATATLGFSVWENLLTRLEYRYDLSTDTFINGTDQQQIAVNVVYSF
jgi:hypothetical protein